MLNYKHILIILVLLVLIRRSINRNKKEFFSGQYWSGCTACPGNLYSSCDRGYYQDAEKGCGFMGCQISCSKEGGGGGNSSPPPVIKTSLTVNNERTVIDRTSYDMLNKNVQKFVAESSSKSAKSCSAAGLGVQTQELNNNIVAGNANIKMGQNMKIEMDFSCVNVSEVKKEVGVEINNMFKNLLSKSTSSSAMDKMLQKVKQQQKNKTIVDSDNATSEVKDDTTINTKIKQVNELSAVIKNITENEFKSKQYNEDIQTCKAQVSGMQVQRFNNNTVGGDLNVDWVQEMDLQAMVKCIQKTRFF